MPQAAIRSATIRSSTFRSPSYLPQIARVVALVQHAPDLRAQTQGVRQHLKHDVAVAGAVAHAHAARPGTAHGRRCRPGRSGFPANWPGCQHPSGGQAPNASSPQIRAHPAVLSPAACLVHTDSQAARACSSPISHSLGCASTRKTNALPSPTRRANSAREYTVGLTGRPSLAATSSSAPNRSA